jgi:hypothetical protein
MMRALLLLCLVGAALYGFLVATEDALKDPDSKGGVALHTQQNHSAGERLSSWGSYLPSPSLGQDPQLATSQPVTLPSQEKKNDPNQSSEQFRAAASGNSGGLSESEVLISRSSTSPARTQVAVVEPPTQPLVAKPPVRKSSKRSHSAKHGAGVSDAEAWNGRWARRAERRRGFGLFMFRPAPRFMGR